MSRIYIGVGDVTLVLQTAFLRPRAAPYRCAVRVAYLNERHARSSQQESRPPTTTTPLRSRLARVRVCVLHVCTCTCVHSNVYVCFVLCAEAVYRTEYPAHTTHVHECVRAWCRVAYIRAQRPRSRAHSKHNPQFSATRNVLAKFLTFRTDESRLPSPTSPRRTRPARPLNLSRLMGQAVTTKMPVLLVVLDSPRITF